MTEKMTPTVVRDGKQFGRVLRLLRLIFGWSQATAAKRYDVSPASVSARETGDRSVTIDLAVAQLAAHGYVLVVMHQDDVGNIPRLVTGELLEALAPGAPHAFRAPPS